jgi:hypothetical protein
VREQAGAVAEGEADGAGGAALEAGGEGIVPVEVPHSEREGKGSRLGLRVAVAPSDQLSDDLSEIHAADASLWCPGRDPVGPPAAVSAEVVEFQVVAEVVIGTCG